MVHIGVDQHKKYSEVAVLDQQGNLVARDCLEHLDKEAMQRYFCHWGGDASVVIEAGPSWYWLYDLVEQSVGSVKLANPAGVRMIADSKVKTDKIDARVLAQLDRLGFVPQAHVPPRAVRDARELHRFRIFLVRLATSLKNRVHAVLDKLGIGHPASDIFGKSGREFLGSLKLRQPYQSELDSCLQLLDAFREQIKTAKRQIHQAISGDRRAELLMSIPGVGEIFAYLILYEVGEIERFASEKRFASYCALACSTHQSGSHIWHGRTGRRGNLNLKWAFTEAAHVAAKKDPALQAYYARQKRNKGSGKAAVAVARKLARATYYILKTGQPYRYNHLSKIHLGKPLVILGRL
jgi:transposase